MNSTAPGSTDRKGHEITQGDDKHPGSRPKEETGKNYGQSVGYGGYDAELNQGESQTGTPDRVRNEPLTGDEEPAASKP